MQIQPIQAPPAAPMAEAPHAPELRRVPLPGHATGRQEILALPARYAIARTVPDPGARSAISSGTGSVDGSPGLTAAQVEAAVRAIRDQVAAHPTSPRSSTGRRPAVGAARGGARRLEWTVLGPDGSEMTVVEQHCLGPIPPERPAVPSPGMTAAELDGWGTHYAAAAVEGDSAGDAA